MSISTFSSYILSVLFAVNIYLITYFCFYKDLSCEIESKESKTESDIKKFINIWEKLMPNAESTVNSQLNRGHHWLALVYP